jgi:hypothetical protein
MNDNYEVNSYKNSRPKPPDHNYDTNHDNSYGSNNGNGFAGINLDNGYGYKKPLKGIPRINQLENEVCICIYYIDIYVYIFKYVCDQLEI